MAETYSVIYPGNFINHLNTYGKPNAAFKAAGRPVGDPHDRQHQAVVVRPGLLAVQKVAYLHVSGAVPAGEDVKGYDLTIASPDSRADDKPRADITGLVVPEGAHLYRVALRVPRLADQPGYYSSGAKDASSLDRSGLLTNATGSIWLEAKATDPTAAPVEGAITATGCNTPALLVDAVAGDFDPGVAATTLVEAVTTTDELTVKLFADLGGVGSLALGGVYVIAEVCYLVEAPVPGLEAIAALEGARVSGYGG